MRELGDAFKAAAATRSLYGLTGLALLALVIVVGLTFFAPILQTAKFILVPIELLLFLSIFVYVVNRTPKVPPQAGEGYYESLVKLGIVYGDEGHLISIDTIRQTTLVENPKQLMLPPPEQEEHTA